ncbi:TonB-dependent receptor plug [Flammeovirgaceae bacterium 311]|nr:TonB-dependent receptor plug [Flammeovirgaceae bacterium 311]
MKKSLLLMMLLYLCGAAYAQQTIRGRVTSAGDAEGLPGVTIVVKGTSTGTVTDIDGNYSLQVPNANATLVFAFTGYERQEVPVNNRTTINVTLSEDVAVLDEIVVTGYGEIRRSEVTGAQTTIGAQEIQKSVNTTIEQAIQGRAAGVYVTQNSGQPGGGISVNIRGINSITGNTEPLYVIDGVQISGGGTTNSSNPLSGLNPADIESMEVLQGPSATAVYGSRATNGVIVITTKRGKSGDVRVNYGYQYSLQTPPQNLEVMNLRQYAQMFNEFKTIAGGSFRDDFLDPSLLGEGTDWQDELFNNAPMNKHQLSLSGGSEKTTYYLSGEYLNQDGIALGSGFDRYSMRLNVDNKAREWLSIGANINVSQTNEKLATSQDNIIGGVFQLPPHIPVTNLDGTWAGGNTDNSAAEQFTPPNPIALAELNTNEITRRQFLGGLNVGVDIIEGLQFRTTFNTNLGFSNATNFRPSYRFGSQVRPNTRLDNTSGTNTYWNWNQMLQYNKQFGKHGINAMVSHEAQASTWQNISAGREGFVVNDLIDLNLGDPNQASNEGGQGDWAMESYLGRIIYNFNEKYILQGAFRADGSVNFGPDNRWGYFPSLSAAWRVSEESFFNVPFINDLRLRFETGLTGNQGGGQGIYGTLGSGVTTWGTGFLPNSYANPSLQWEDTQTNNLGLNLSFFKNKIQIEADYYVKNTENLLLRNPLPWYMGTNGAGSVASPWVNIGSLQTKGWGLAFNTINMDKGGFQWTTNLNLSHFRTEVTEFYSDAAIISRTSWWMDDWTQRSVVGEQPWFFYGYVEEGIFQSVEELENSALPADNTGAERAIAENSIWVGDIKYRDINGDGVINQDDQTNIGSPWPKLFAGFTNSFSYKGFDLSILITSTYGNDIYNMVRYQNSQPNNINVGRNLLIGAFDYARVAYAEDDVDQANPYLLNPGTTVARMAPTDENDNYNRHTNKYVEDGSFIRLKNISLNYNLPSSIVGRQNVIKGARLGVSAQNVATLTNYSGYDPEVGAYVGGNASADNQAMGVDNGRYPLTPVYTLSLGIDF